MGRRTLALYGITTYRTRIALSNEEWAKLYWEAQRTKVTGQRLIENILVDVCRALPAPPPVEAEEPPPPDEGEAEEVVG